LRGRPSSRIIALPASPEFQVHILVFSLQPVTALLILANVAVFVLQQDANEHLLMSFALWPWGSGLLQPWQVVSYSFLHAGGTHLGFNMLALFMFGAEVEHALGSSKYLLYYLVCVVAAALIQLAVTIMHVSQAGYTIGASGGVFGLLLAFGMLFPRRKLVPLLLPIPMPAWLFVTLYGAIELWLGVTQTQEGVAHFAHLGGMLGGWLLLQYWRGRRPPAPSR
jgi:membrane associated rhomboid family serine protease